MPFVAQRTEEGKTFNKKTPKTVFFVGIDNYHQLGYYTAGSLTIREKLK